MLSSQNRLKNKKDFDKIFKKGKGLRGDFLYIRFGENNLDHSRFGFIVSTKFSKKAVLRNKIKRMLRAIIRAKLVDIKKGFDVAFIVSPLLKNDGFDDLDKKTEALLKKAKLI